MTKMTCVMNAYDRFGNIVDPDDREALAQVLGDRIINKTTVTYKGAEIRVSTANIVYAMSTGLDDPPYHYETMLFTEPEEHPLAHQLTRYCTLAEAVYGHEQAVADLERGVLPEWIYQP